jgi:hypothetical protein
MPKPPVVTTPAGHGLVATTDTQIDGIGAFPTQHIDDPALKGKVADLTSEQDGERNRWTLAVEDDANLRHTYSIELPSKVTFAIATGTNVLVEPEAGKICVSDDKGALILAIDKLPAGWSFDVHGTAIQIKEPGGAAVEVISTPWRSFELAGAKLVGTGTTPSELTVVRAL